MCQRNLRLPVHLGPAAKACVFALLVALPLLAGVWAGLEIRAQAIAEGLEPWPFFVHELVFTPLPVGTLAFLAYSLGWQAWRRLRRRR